MTSISEPLIADEAEEKSWQHDFSLQLSGEDRLNPAQNIYGHGAFDSPSLTISEDLYQELTAFSVSSFKNEHVNWEVSFPPVCETQIPKSASPESECSQDHPPSLICGSVPNQESTSFHQHFPTRDSTKKEANASTNSQPVTQSRKRSAGKAFSSDQVEDDGVRARQKGKTDADSGDKTRRQLACPFQKLDSHKHHECLKYALHRIKDVKQHVYRRHKQPDYYCARCFEIFKTAETRDEHARRRSCDNLDTPGFEGISDEQRSKLNKSSSRGLDTQGQWFEMWDIIFPGKERPNSAWVGSYMEEMVPLLRSLWRNKSSSILAKALSKEKANTLDSGILDGVVGAIFDCLEAETSASLGRNARWSCTQGQVKLSDDQSPIPTPPSTFITDSTQFIFGEPQEMFPEFNITGQDEVFQNGFVFGER